MTIDDREEFQERLDFIRSLANNSITKDRIDMNLNRIVMLGKKAGKEEALQVAEKAVEEEADSSEFDTHRANTRFYGKRILNRIKEQLNE